MWKRFVAKICAQSIFWIPLRSLKLETSFTPNFPAGNLQIDSPNMALKEEMVFFICSCQAYITLWDILKGFWDSRGSTKHNFPSQVINKALVLLNTIELLECFNAWLQSIKYPVCLSVYGCHHCRSHIGFITCWLKLKSGFHCVSCYVVA